MSGVNKVILIGNCSDIKRGDNYLSFGLATNEVFKDKDGNKVTRTEWHNVKCFAKLAEVLNNLISKGASLYVEGSIRTEEYEGKKYTNIIAASVTVLQFADRGEAKEANPPQSEPQTPKPQPEPEPIVAPGAEESDLPF